MWLKQRTAGWGEGGVCSLVSGGRWHCVIPYGKWHSIAVSWSFINSYTRPLLVLSRLDYCNATPAGIPSYLLQQLLSVMNSAARLVFSSSRYDHITPLLHQQHWLRAPERIEFKLAVLVYKCLHGTAPSYLADELEYTADFWTRRRLRSSSSLTLNVRRTRLSTVGDRAFPVAAARIWNSLPQYVCFSELSEGFSFQAFIQMTFTTTFVCLRSDIVIFGHLINRSFLLFYWISDHMKMSLFR